MSAVEASLRNLGKVLSRYLYSAYGWHIIETLAINWQYKYNLNSQNIKKNHVVRLSYSKQFDMTHYLDFLLASDDYFFERVECNIYVLPSLYYQSEVFSNCFWNIRQNIYYTRVFLLMGILVICIFEFRRSNITSYLILIEMLPKM